MSVATHAGSLPTHISPLGRPVPCNVATAITDSPLYSKTTTMASAAAMAASLSSASPGGITFTPTDTSGNHFTSPFGDLHLMPPELSAAFGRHTQLLQQQHSSQGFNPQSPHATASNHAGTPRSMYHGGGSIDTGMLKATSAMTMAKNIAADVDDDDEDEEHDEALDMASRLPTPRLKPSAAIASTPSKRERRTSKSSSTSSAAGSSGAPPAGAAAAAMSPRNSNKSQASSDSAAVQSTPKASTSKKSASASAVPTLNRASSAASGAAAAASPAPASAAKKLASEVKGERDSLTGRRKIKIQFIDDDSRRHITFSKRKAGIMKKAYELSVLTGTQVLLLIVSQTGLVFTFTTPKLRPVVMEQEGRELIQRCLSAPDDEDEDGDDTMAAGMGGDDDEDLIGGDGSEDDDDDDISSHRSPASPSKGPITQMRPGPTMTATGSTPKRSGGGTGDGGAAGRRSRAATMSNATVRQQLKATASPEQAVAALSVPPTPATPTASHAAAAAAAASRSRKRRKTTTEQMGPPAASSSISASEMYPNVAALPEPHSAPVYPSAGLVLSPQGVSNFGQPPNSAPPSFENLPSTSYGSAPPPHLQQMHAGGGHFRAPSNSSSFLLGPGGGIDPTSTQGGSGNDFFFSPVDLSGAASRNGMPNGYMNPSMGYMNPAAVVSRSATMTASPHQSASASLGTHSSRAGSSTGFSPSLGGSASFQSFGQAYASLNPSQLTGQQSMQQHSMSPQQIQHHLTQQTQHAQQSQQPSAHGTPQSIGGYSPSLGGSGHGLGLLSSSHPFGSGASAGMQTPGAAMDLMGSGNWWGGPALTE